MRGPLFPVKPLPAPWCYPRAASTRPHAPLAARGGGFDFLRLPAGRAPARQDHYQAAVSRFLRFHIACRRRESPPAPSAACSEERCSAPLTHSARWPREWLRTLSFLEIASVQDSRTR